MSRAVRPNAQGDRGRVALLFRYGLASHAELHHIIPDCLRIVAQRHDVLYAGPRCGDMRIPGVCLLQLPYAVNRASSRDKFWKTVLWYLYLPYLSWRCRRWKADLIWIDESLPLFGWIVQVCSGRPTLLTVVDFFLEVYREKHPWLRPIAALSYVFERRAWRKAAAIVTRTRSMRNYLAEQGVDAAKIHMIRDVFSTDVFAPLRSESLRKRLGYAAEDVVLVHHGILHPNKGIRRVLEWLVPVLRSDPHLKFLVIGDGEERAELEARVEQEGLRASVAFTGWLPSSGAVAEHLNAGDVGLVMRIGQFTDHFHVTGTLVHCLLCGLPVLAARLDGILEIVDEGQEGVLFDPSSREEFVRGLRDLCADAGRRAQMGRNGRRKALAEFGPESVLDQTVELICRQVEA